VIEQLQPALVVAATVEDWSHCVELWASTATAPLSRSSDHQETIMSVTDHFPPNTTMPPFASPEAMTDATERLLRACGTIFDAYVEAYQQAMSHLSDGSLGMPTGAPTEWPDNAYTAQLAHAGKQIARAYVETMDTCLSMVREMLDE
jgi:hypothetical protein